MGAVLAVGPKRLVLPEVGVGHVCRVGTWVGRRSALAGQSLDDRTVGSSNDGGVACWVLSWPWGPSVQCFPVLAWAMVTWGCLCCVTIGNVGRGVVVG